MGKDLIDNVKDNVSVADVSVRSDVVDGCANFRFGNLANIVIQVICFMST